MVEVFSEPDKNKNSNIDMFSDTGKKIGSQIEYPDWVKDELDKILCGILTGDRSGKEYTISIIKNRVFEQLIRNVSQGTTLSQKLDNLVKAGILQKRDKETNIQLFSVKPKPGND